MSDYKKLLKKAEKKGWKTPINNAIPESAWVAYWQACEEYERNPDAGRPVVPHRSGSGLADAIKAARGGDAPVPFKGYA